MNRSIFAGMTDYAGVPMDVILSDLRDWRDKTARSVEELKRLKAKVETYRDRIDWPNAKLAYIDYFIDRFSRYIGDFERLLTELPRSVRGTHIQIVQQMYESADRHQRRCLQFKDEHIERSLKDETLRGLIDSIYCDTREMLIDYLDLINLVPRLRTFIGAPMEASGGSGPHQSLAKKGGNAQAARGKARVNSPLPVKKMDFGRWMDGAALTPKQRECFSLKMEYQLSVSEISRRLEISRPVVDKHIAAATQKIDRARANDSTARKAAAKRTPQ
jgi:DNA-binding CsgD family transcriptional regulator